jgi:hypothetical protein
VASVKVAQSLLDAAEEEASINIGGEQSRNDSGPPFNNKLMSEKLTSSNPPINEVKGKHKKTI